MARDVPMVESTEYRPPTQSQKPNALAGSMPNAGDLVERRRDRHEVLGDRGVAGLVVVGRAQLLPEPRAGEAGVGQRLERAERLGRDDEQRGRRVEALDRLREVAGVDVGDEPHLEAVLHVRLERLVRHDRAQVGAADADVDDGPHALAGHAGPLAGADLVGEREHLGELGLHVAVDVLAVDDERRRGARRAAQGRVQHRAVLGHVDVVAAQHRLEAVGQADLVREPR